MNAKFLFQVAQHQVQMDDGTKTRKTEYTKALPDGEYEMIIRKRVKWNTDRMRKYFHLIMKFIRIECQKQGHVTTEAQLKLDFKDMFGPKEDKKTLLGKKQVPISTSYYDAEMYRLLITDVKAWCIDKMHFDIPDKDDLDIGE
jgi:hypothetical protein